MKKTCCFAALFLAVHWGVMAQSGGIQHGLSVGTSTGFLYGDCEEIVYHNGRSKEKLSQLLWEIKPMFYLGLDLGYSLQRPDCMAGFFAEGSIKFGLSHKTGEMQDRDWDSKNLTGTDTPGWLTNYSVHDIETTKLPLLLDFSLGMSFNVSDAITLKGFLTYSAMIFSFVSEGGSILYTTYSAHLDDVTKEVSYTQKWHLLSLGFSFCGSIDRHFGIELSLKMSPYLIWVPTEDNHIMRALKTRETLFGGLSFEPGMVFSFKQNSLISYNLNVSYRYIGFVRGDATYSGHEIYEKYNHQQSVTIKNIAGAGYSAVNAGFTVKFDLF